MTCHSPPFLILVLALTLPQCQAEDMKSVRENWITSLTSFERIFYPHKGAIIEILESFVKDEKGIKQVISSPCFHGLQDFSTGLSMNNVTQMLMIDSMSSPSGILKNQGYNLGSYRQCLESGSRYVLFGMKFLLPQDKKITKLPREFNNNSTNINWMISWSENIGFLREHPYYVAACVPSQCDQNDIQSIIDSDIAARMMHPLSLIIKSTDSYIDEKLMTNTQVISFTLIAVLILVTAYATMSSYFCNRNKYFEEFDAIRNTIGLLSDRKNPNSLTAALDIFRVTCILSGFFVHVLYGMSGSITFRVSVFVSSFNSFLVQFSKIIPINLGTISMIASCRSSFIWLNIMSGKRVKFAEFFIIRILRSIPVIAASILIVGTFPAVNFIGPFGKVIQEFTINNCYHNGWKELAFISNYYPINQMCNIVNWHVSVDLQLYAVSFFILTILSRNEKLGLRLLIFIIIAGTIASGSYLVHNDLKLLVNSSISEVHVSLHNLNKIMFHTIHFIPIYGIGMLLGYFLFKQGNQKYPTSAFRFILVVVVLPTIFVGLNCHMYDDDFEFHFKEYPFIEVIYTFTARLISSSLCALLFHAFMNASSPIILAISNSKVILILSRLSFCMFATHSLVIHYIFASLDVQTGTPTFLCTVYLSVMVISLILGYIMYILVEAPFQLLVTRLMSKKKTSVEEDAGSENNKEK